MFWGKRTRLRDVNMNASKITKWMSQATLALTVLVSATTVWADDAVEQANNTITEINEIITNGNELLSNAQQTSDVMMMDCINAQLINARGFLNIAQSSRDNLKDAQSRQDDAAIQHNQKIITLAASKAREIEIRMNQCSSGNMHSTGDTALVSNRTCAVQPCLTDHALDPSTNMGLTQEEQTQAKSYIPDIASPYL